MEGLLQTFYSPVDDMFMKHPFKYGEPVLLTTHVMSEEGYRRQIQLGSTHPLLPGEDFLFGHLKGYRDQTRLGGRPGEFKSAIQFTLSNPLKLLTIRGQLAGYQAVGSALPRYVPYIEWIHVIDDSRGYRMALGETEVDTILGPFSLCLSDVLEFQRSVYLSR